MQHDKIRTFLCTLPLFLAAAETPFVAADFENFTDLAVTAACTAHTASTQTAEQYKHNYDESNYCDGRGNHGRYECYQRDVCISTALASIAVVWIRFCSWRWVDLAANVGGIY